MDFERVEQLRNKLRTDYPVLNKIKPLDQNKIGAFKGRWSFDAPVRPTFTSDEMTSLMKNSSKFVRKKEIEFPATPKNSSPITIKVQEWEIVRTLHWP